MPLLSLLLAALRVLVERESERTSLRKVPSSFGVVGWSTFGIPIGEGSAGGISLEGEGV